MRTSLLTVVLAGALLAGCSSDQPALPLDSGTTLPAPTVTSITPDEGAAAGGYVVSVIGTNFQEGATLSLGGVAATGVTVVSDQRLTGKAPKRTTGGAVDVKVVNPDGQSAVLTKAFTYQPPPETRTAVDSCKLLSPRTLTVHQGGQTSVAVVGTVIAAGVTDSPGQGTAIVGQVGFGPAGSDATGAAWTWALASYDDGQSGADFDAYSSALVGPAPGDYRYAFRFQFDGGEWTYCDLDGTEVGGFTADQLGVLTAEGPGVDWCNLQWPPAASSSPLQPATLPDGTSIAKLPDGGADTSVAPGTIYSHVYKAGVTTDPDQGEGIAVEMGVGPADAGPGAASWTWVAADYNPTCTTCNDGHDDEYEAQLVGPPTEGTYHYAFRTKLDGGDYVYCGINNPVAADALDGVGVLTNTGPSVTVNWCKLDTVVDAVEVGKPATIFSQVYKPGTTEDDGTNSPLITGELGVGPAGTAAASADWSWSPATFDHAGAGDLGHNYSYRAGVTPDTAGAYAYAYRYRFDGGPEVYCDSLGVSDGGTENLGALTVTEPSAIQCAVESLSEGAVGSGAPLTAVANVYVPGVTDAVGQGAGVIAQVGVGAWPTSTVDPSWTWASADYLDDPDADTDRYTATVTPAYTGDRSVNFRVSVDDGGSWVACDATGVPDGGYLQVTPFVAVEGGIGWCNLQYPVPNNGGTLTEPGTPVYGQVYAAGITDTAGNEGAITAQLGVGQAGEDPGFGAGWTWTDGTFNVAQGNNFEYLVPYPAEPSGSSNYAFRYSLDGVTWCYGDQTGAGDGFAGGDLGAATLP